MKSSRKGRVLVVDDERSMREMLEIFLGREGYDVMGESSASDALAILAISTGGPLPAVHRAWRAFLLDDPGSLGAGVQPDFQFPYRRESLPVLEWADAHSSDWTWTYLHALSL